MARTIDTSEGYDTLDDDEILYLAQRDNREAQGEAHRRGLNLNGDVIDVASQPYFGDANTTGRTVEDLQAIADSSPHHNVEDEDDDEDYEDDEDDDEDDDEPLTFDDYMTWKADELRGELLRRDRGLSLEGKKEELAKRLVDDDTAQAAVTPA